MRYVVIRKHTLDSILIGTAMFCVFTYALLEDVNVTIPMTSAMKMPLLLIGALCLIPMQKAYTGLLASRKYMATFLFLAFWILLLLWGMVMNRAPAFGETPVKKTLRLILYLIDLFVLMVILAERGMGQSVLRFVYRYLLVLVIANDFLMFSRLMTFSVGRHETYLVGSKFSVSYLHMNFLAFFMINSKRGIASFRCWLLTVLLLAGYTLAVAVRVGCMTGMLGCIALAALLILMKSPARERLLLITTPGVLLLLIGLSVLFAYIAQWMLSLPAAAYLVKDILGRDMTLTGRTEIYHLYTQTIQDHWLTGYGYGNAYDVTSALFGFDNVQNAVLQWVLQIGVIGTTGMIALLLHIFSRISWKETRHMTQILALAALIYTYVILGAIETTFNMAFILWFALVFMLVFSDI